MRNFTLDEIIDAIEKVWPTRTMDVVKNLPLKKKDDLYPWREINDAAMAAKFPHRYIVQIIKAL